MIQLKTATVQDDYAWIWEGDDALDKSKDGWREEYDAALESGDLARMPLRPGVKPTIFYLRHPTPLLKRVWAGLWQSKPGSVAARKVAQLALVKAESLGKELRWDGRDMDGFPCVPEATMDELDQVPELVDSIALAAITELRPK